MALSLTMLQNDLTYMIADLPTAVTWSGTTYSCVVSDITSEDELAMAGVMESNGFSVVISLASFTNGYPDSGDQITIGGNGYRVLSYSDSPDGISRTLTCGGNLQ